MLGDITATIDVTGSNTGTIAISLPAEFAIAAIRQLIDEDESVALSSSVLHDGIGELITMIGTGAQTSLTGTDNAIDISPPTIHGGRGHELDHGDSVTTTSVTFRTECGEEFALDVTLQLG